MAQGRPRGSAKDHINCPNCSTEIKLKGVTSHFIVCECGQTIQLASVGKSVGNVSVNGQLVEGEVRSLDFK